MPEFPSPSVTIDVVLLTIRNERLCVALAPRRSEPFKGKLALIGGYVHVDEDADAEATVARVLADKGGLVDVYVEQLQTMTGATRDPRGWSLSVVYLALIPYEAIEKAAGHLEIIDVGKVKGLPFDHDEIVAAAVSRLRGKGTYSSLPGRLLGRSFTLPELHRTYQIVRGEKIDPATFRRKILELNALVELDQTTHSLAARRPSQLYRLADGAGLFDRRI